TALRSGRHGPRMPRCCAGRFARTGGSMLIVRRSLVEQIEAAKSKEDLYPFFQDAISLELATIPVYLAGIFTLKKTKSGEVNHDVAYLVDKIARQEMLHTALVANTLIALCGRPVLNTAEVVPKYPGPLPRGVDAGLIVHMRPISLGVILDTYMSIEEPDVILQPTGVQIPLLPPRIPDRRRYASIGDFYRALIKKIQELPPGSFDSGTARCQVSEVFRVNTTVTDLATATAALDLIISQGEGTSTSPIQNHCKDPAHFYSFAEIVMGRRLVVTGTTYDFSGD